MAEPEGGKPFWPDWMTPRRWYEFTRNVIRMEGSVARLEVDNRDLRAEVRDLQRQPGETRAQVALLTDFVRDSLRK